MTRWHWICTAVLAVCTVVPEGAWAQPAPAGAERLQFDAVSVRPSQRKFVMIGGDFLDPLSNMAPPPGGLFTWNVPLSSLVIFAYDLKSPQLRRQAFESLPKPYNTMQDGWLAVEARAEGQPTRDDVRQMVRSMLADRFQFAAHVEKHEGDVLALVVAKPGPALKPHVNGEPCTLSSSLTDVRTYPHAYPAYEGVPPRCGVFNRELSRSGERRLEMLDVTMDQIANSIAAMEGLPVVDQSGLTGRFDAVLEFAPPMPPRAEDADDAVGAPQLASAIERQLGMKLVKQRAQVDAFVIDHAGALTEN